MKISDIIPKTKKKEATFQSDIRPYKPKRWINMMLSIFILVSCIGVWVQSKSVDMYEEIPQSEMTFVRSYLMNKITTNKEAQEWIRDYEISTVPSISFRDKLDVSISNVQVISNEKTIHATEKFHVSFYFKAVDEEGKEIVNELQYGILEVKKLDENVYAVVKGFEYADYDYLVPEEEVLKEAEESQANDQELELESVSKVEEESIQKQVEFFFKQFNTNIEEAELLVSTDIVLVAKSSGSYDVPTITNIGKKDGTYFVDLKIQFTTHHDITTTEHIYRVQINELSEKITSIELLQ